METLRQKIYRTHVQDSRGEANAEAAKEQLSLAHRQERARAQNRELWIEHYAWLAESYALRSAECQRKARALEEGVS